MKEIILTHPLATFLIALVLCTILVLWIIVQSMKSKEKKERAKRQAYNMEHWRSTYAKIEEEEDEHLHDLKTK